MSKKNNDDLIQDTDINVNVSKNTKKTSTKKYSKNQILRSSKFADFTDIISISVKDDELLSCDEVQGSIDSFLKGKVK